MDEVERIVDELRRAFEGQAWHGPALMEVFSGVDASAAAARPADGGHTIWEIALHIRAWIDAVREHLEGAAMPDLTPEQDWPAAPASTAEAWDGTLSALLESDRKLRESVEGWSPDRLEEMVPGKPYTYGVMLHGVAQHNAYHAGQVAVRRRSSGARG